MPLYDFRCPRCQTVHERLVRADSTPACDTCGQPLERLVSLPAAPGKSAGMIARARARAAREGHFSND